MSSEDDQVGSVAEEAAKLIGALSDWAREHDPADHPAEGGAATGAPECDWCPVCRAVHLVRECSPEVRTHLASAAASLMQAAAGLMAAAAREPGRAPDRESGREPGSGGARPDGVEHIDLDPDTDSGEETP